MIDSSNDHYILDVSRARSLLGWEPKHNLRDSLPTIVAALKRHPGAWYRNNKLNENLVAWNDNQASKPAEPDQARQSVVKGKSVFVRVDLGGRLINKKKKINNTTTN